MIHIVSDVSVEVVGFTIKIVCVALLKSKIRSRIKIFKTISATLFRIPLNKNRAIKISMIHRIRMHRMFLVHTVEVLTLAQIVK